MDTAFRVYIAAWSAACFAAVLLFLRRPGDFVISRHAYWHFLVEPWKLAAAIAGTALITLVAPYTGDPTWDYVDGCFMSVLCYTTAPWVVGTLYRSIRGHAGLSEIYVAVCTWLFSASWSYDIYLVWRDGAYPFTWLPNLFASSFIYLCAGLFWNLEYRPGRGVIFSFMDDGWPRRSDQSCVWRLGIYAAILALPALGAVAIFLL